MRVKCVFIIILRYDEVKKFNRFILLKLFESVNVF